MSLHIVQKRPHNNLLSSISLKNVKIVSAPNTKTAKISPTRDWRSTLHNWRFCHVRSHVTQKLGQISNIWPKQI